MIVLDTNVLSELIRPEPAAAVLGWVTRQPAPALFVTSVTQAEIFYGLALLSPGRRREALERAMEQMFAEDFARRVLPFDTAAARAYARIVAGRRVAGRPVGQSDAKIAAIALVHGAAVATRNVADFLDCGVTVIDPWTSDLISSS